MSLADKLLKEFEDLSEDKKRAVIDFAQFLKSKEKETLNEMMELVIKENKEALEELSK